MMHLLEKKEILHGASFLCSFSFSYHSKINRLSFLSSVVYRLYHLLYYGFTTLS